MNTTRQESARVEAISHASLYAAGVNTAAARYSFRIARRHLVPGSLLELGPAEGVMTDLIATAGYTDVTLVEGSALFCADLQRRHPGFEVVHSLFECFEPDGRFDNILLGHVLEHVEDPVQILRQARHWLRPHGRIFAAVPNARSVHRQAAVVMGLLASEDALNPMDLHHGHRRVFNPESFRSLFLQAGLAIDVFGGYWLKPVSNGQTDASWSPEMVDAFMQLGERYPDIAAEIYVVASSGGA